MSLQSDIPKGATHYHSKNKSAIFYKIEDGRLYFYNHFHNSWFGSILFLDDDDLIPLNVHLPTIYSK